MIKQKVKKVTYHIWEECSCGGRLKTFGVELNDTDVFVNTCEECNLRVYTLDRSPRYEEVYEEVEE